MPDIALSPMPSPLAALLSGGAADSAAASAAAPQGSDPFAALLASAAVIKKTDAPAGAATTDPVALLLASAAPAAIHVPVAPALPVPSQILPAETVPAPVAFQVRTKAKTESEEDDHAAESGGKDDEGDPLADAIASGATAVLALAPVVAAPIQEAAPIEASIPIDAPLTPQPLKLASLPTLTALTKAQAQTRTQTQTQAEAGAQGGQDIAPQHQAGSDAAQPDAHHQPQAQATDAKPAAQQLPPEVTKAVVAALTQGEPDPTPIAQPDAPSGPATSEAVKPQPQPQPQQPTQAALPAQREAAPVLPLQARRRSDEVPAPRRTGDTRKRTDLPPADAATAGLPQRVDMTQPTSARAVTEVHGKGDTIVEQTLTIARDGAWLDKLAHDIVHAGSGNDLHFKLQPQNLGALSVAIRQSDEGASIRLTADTQTTHDILVDAQPKLIAEARAQGLKVADTQVDIRQDQNHSQNQSSNQDAQRWAQHQAGQNGTSHNGQNRQSSPGHQPFVSNLARKADADSESPERDSDARYA